MVENERYWSQEEMNPNVYDFMRNLEQEIAINRVKGQIEQILPTLGKHRIEELRRVIDRHYNKRFKGKRRTPKYGSLNKGFTDNQLEAFLRTIKNEKFRLLFSYQAYMGLRVGEACRVNLGEINLETREIRIKTEKTRLIDSLLLPLPLFKKTVEFAQAHAGEIQQSGGYLFFRDTQRSKFRTEGYIEVNYVRNQFRHFLQLSHLDEVYDLSEEQGKAPRKLHRLTTHSLRHYAITRFSRSTNGNLVLTSRFARHTDTSSTMTYVRTDKKEIFDVIDSIAIGEVALLKKRL